MTDEQINTAIAKACGWFEIERNQSNGWLYQRLIGKNHQMKITFDVKTPIPDYCQDLNAMHEAENVLTEFNWFIYVSDLAKIVRFPNQSEVKFGQSIHATARQRAEAFLRTLGKWEEVQA